MRVRYVCIFFCGWCDWIYGYVASRVWVTFVLRSRVLVSVYFCVFGYGVCLCLCVGVGGCVGLCVGV